MTYKINNINNEGARETLESWFGHVPQILYVYEEQGLVICSVVHGGCLYFVRLFTINGFWQISQDAAYYPVDGKNLPPLKQDK